MPRAGRPVLSASSDQQVPSGKDPIFWPAAEVHFLALRNSRISTILIAGNPPPNLISAAPYMTGGVCMQRTVDNVLWQHETDDALSKQKRGNA